MSRKADLRLQRTGTVINMTSSAQETKLGKALKAVIARIEGEFAVRLQHDRDWRLHGIVQGLADDFPDVPFDEVMLTSAMKPDGGILSILDGEGEKHVILITEVKNQGTNDLRKKEGLKKQARGNAIERLGKNVIGFRTAMLTERITPFVCFGYGCDFEDGSSILDRVKTIAMFGPLNEVCVADLGEAGVFNRGSFFFREEEWTEPEMEDVMYEVAKRSIYYYFSKYGEQSFKAA
ncbi:MAG TPA: EcoRI family type II restriction endonuclease [Solirubrobacterales bacterium]|nr:EcoRI family type II restriction endonuclease [Solirubrobacterales bacterium]